MGNIFFTLFLGIISKQNLIQKNFNRAEDSPRKENSGSTITIICSLRENFLSELIASESKL